MEFHKKPWVNDKNLGRFNFSFIHGLSTKRWTGLIGPIGAIDQRLADVITEKQEDKLPWN